MAFISRSWRQSSRSRAATASSGSRWARSSTRVSPASSYDKRSGYRSARRRRSSSPCLQPRPAARARRRTRHLTLVATTAVRPRGGRDPAAGGRKRRTAMSPPRCDPHTMRRPQGLIRNSSHAISTVCAPGARPPRASRPARRFRHSPGNRPVLWGPGREHLSATDRKHARCTVSHSRWRILHYAAGRRAPNAQAVAGEGNEALRLGSAALDRLTNGRTFARRSSRSASAQALRRPPGTRAG